MLPRIASKDKAHGATKQLLVTNLADITAYYLLMRGPIFLAGGVLSTLALSHGPCPFGGASHKFPNGASQLPMHDSSISNAGGARLIDRCPIVLTDHLWNDIDERFLFPGERPNTRSKDPLSERSRRQGHHCDTPGHNGKAQ